MNAMKVYPKEGEKKRLLLLFHNEGSILGTDVDNEGKYYIIIDGDYSKFYKNYKVYQVEKGE